MQCKPSKRKIALLITYVVFLFATSLVPMDRPIEGLEFVFAIKPTLQNLLHIPLYMVLAILCLQVLQPYALPGRTKVIMAIVLPSLIGILNELTQIAVPGRYLSSLDAICNVIGSILGAVLYYRLERSGDNIVRRMICE